MFWIPRHASRAAYKASPKNIGSTSGPRVSSPSDGSRFKQQFARASPLTSLPVVLRCQLLRAGLRMTTKLRQETECARSNLACMEALDFDAAQPGFASCIADPHPCRCTPVLLCSTSAPMIRAANSSVFQHLHIPGFSAVNLNLCRALPCFPPLYYFAQLLLTCSLY